MFSTVAIVRRTVIATNANLPPVPSRRISSLHPEERLRASRRQALQRLGLPAAADEQRPPELPNTAIEQLSKGKGPAAAAAAAEPASRMSVCAANDHPDHRLRLARQRAMQKMQIQDPSETVVARRDTRSALSSSSNSSGPHRHNDGENSSPSADNRLKLARLEAAKRVQKFRPYKRRKKRLPVSLPALYTDLTPPPRRNDGLSSGAVTDERLRMARKGAIDRLKPPPQDM